MALNLEALCAPPPLAGLIAAREEAWREYTGALGAACSAEDGGADWPRCDRARNAWIALDEQVTAARAAGVADMAHIEIKHRWTNGVLFSGEYPSLRDAVIAAVNARASLADANLAGANLAGANLAGAYLRGANLAGANLAGAYLRGAYLRGAYLDGANLAGADLAGAKWRDGITLTRRPLQVHGLAWPVTILDEHMQIGCELHSLADWAAFDNDRIACMGGAAARRFWRDHKAALLALAASDGRGVALQTKEAV